MMRKDFGGLKTIGPESKVVYDYFSQSDKKHYSTVHTHIFHELYFLLEGQTKFFVSGELFEMDANSFMFVSKNILHKTDDIGLKKKRILLYIEDSLFDGEWRHILHTIANLKFVKLPEDKLTEVMDYFKKMELEQNNPSPFSDYFINIYTLLICSILCKYRKENIRDNVDKIYICNNITIDDIHDFIIENINTELSLSAFSDYFYINKSYFSRKFKQVSGVNLNEYVNIIRVSQAEKLLKKGNLSITDICTKCGFNSSSYFSSVFKAIKGVSPLQYAKKNHIKLKH